MKIHGGGTLELSQREALDLIERLARGSAIAFLHGQQVVANYVQADGTDRRSIQIQVSKE